jgi:hypothetical protein
MTDSTAGLKADPTKATPPSLSRLGMAGHRHECVRHTTH